MFYRYASVKTAEDDSRSETERALAWCIQAGVGPTLEPGTGLNRGELALVLCDYIKAVVK